MMKIINIAWKDLIMRFSDRTEILFFLILPVVFTFLLSGGASQGSDSPTPLLVVDEDGSKLASEFASALIENRTIDPQIVSFSEAERAFADKKAPAWLIIPSGFESGLLSGGESRLELRKTPNNLRADAADQAIRTAVSEFDRSLGVARSSVVEAELLASFSNEQERVDYFNSSLTAAKDAFSLVPNKVEVNWPEKISTTSYDPVAQASAGQLVTWVFIPLLGISGLFANERNQKTLERLLSTPTHKATFLLGTIAGQLGLAIVQIGILIGFGALILNVDWGRSPSGLAVMALSFSLASVAFGTMLGTFVKTEKQASNLSIMLGMVMALLGGCWYPLELFPQVLQTAVKVLPTTWAMQGFSGLVMRGQDLTEILPSAMVLVVFALLFFIVGVKRFKYE
jgi:ABC-2 type transport system permease protein